MSDHSYTAAHFSLDSDIDSMAYNGGVGVDPQDLLRTPQHHPSTPDTTSQPAKEQATPTKPKRRGPLDIPVYFEGVVQPTPASAMVDGWLNDGAVGLSPPREPLVEEYPEINNMAGGDLQGYMQVNEIGNGDLFTGGLDLANAELLMDPVANTQLLQDPVANALAPNGDVFDQVDVLAPAVNILDPMGEMFNPPGHIIDPSSPWPTSDAGLAAPETGLLAPCQPNADSAWLTAMPPVQDTFLDPGFVQQGGLDLQVLQQQRRRIIPGGSGRPAPMVVSSHRVSYMADGTVVEETTRFL